MQVPSSPWVFSRLPARGHEVADTHGTAVTHSASFLVSMAMYSDLVSV